MMLLRKKKRKSHLYEHNEGGMKELKGREKVDKGRQVDGGLGKKKRKKSSLYKHREGKMKEYDFEETEVKAERKE